MASKLLSLCKSVDLRLWAFDHPLRQFLDLPSGIVDKIEAKRLSLDHLRDMNPNEIGGWWWCVCVCVWCVCVCGVCVCGVCVCCVCHTH